MDRYTYYGTATWMSMLNAYTPTNTTTAFPAGTPFVSGYFPTAKQAMNYNEETSMVDAMCLAYTGALPANRAPVVSAAGIVVSGARSRCVTPRRIAVGCGSLSTQSHL